jgi:hypothetical protein
LALRRSDQLFLDKFFDAILQYRPAIGHTGSLLPMEVLPFVILLEERKKFDKLHAEMLADLQELEQKIDKLFPLPK